jgi:hypothetical protein
MPRSFHVIECEQRSAEWVAARCGLITASRAADMLAKPRKGATESVVRRNLRVELALETLTGKPCEGNGYLSADMRRGMELEADARAAYEAATGDLIQTVGFLRHNDLPIGCSPDGIVGDFEGGFEAKCPIAAIHWEYLQRGGSVPPEYLPQLIHSLYVTGLPWWDFVSWHPAFPEPLRLYRVRTARDSVDLTAYALAVSTFYGEVLREYDAMRALAGVGA